MKRRLVETVSAIVICTYAAPSQTGIPSIVQGVHGEAISLSGDLGTYGELYSISGREIRRPSSTARLYFRPTLAFFDAMTVSFNLLLSTEGSSRSFQHQLNQINQFGITPRWDWGYANAGDFAEAYSPYTLNGILVRGGGVTINPGILRFSVIGGYTRRGGVTGGSGDFDRYLYGGRIGIGRDQESFFDIVFLRVRDIPSKFQIVQPDSVPIPDSTQVGTTVNPFQEAPQENLVLGFVSCLRLFENTLVLQTEAAGSAFTRDMNSSPLNDDKIPAAVRNVYTARLSTNVDYAYNSKLMLNLRPVSFIAGLRRIGPGFNSLGVASLINDQRELSLGTNVHFQRWSGAFTWSRQNDNVIGQKLNTTIRQTFATNVNVRPTDFWTMSLTENVLSMRNYAAPPESRIDFLTLNIGTSQNLMLEREGIIRSLSVSYMFQMSSDNNPVRAANASTSSTVTAASPMTLGDSFMLVPSMSLVFSRFGNQPSSTVQMYSVAPQYRAPDNSLTASLTLTLSKSGPTSSFQTGVNATYRLTNLNTITLTIRRTGFTGIGSDAGGYSEYIAGLTVSQTL